MFRNYFKVALRHMKQNKAFALINIIGLSIGISASLVICLVVQYHYSFDRFEPDRDRIYRVVSDYRFSGSPYYNRGVPSPVAAAVAKDIPGIEVVDGFHEYYGNNVRTGDAGKTGKGLFRNQDAIILADPAYFGLVPYRWIAGAPNSLTAPFKVVLTEERARAYFPGIPLMSIPGKTIYYNDSIVCTVSGIVAVLPEKSDFRGYKEFISQSTIAAGHLDRDFQMKDWNSTTSNTQLFVKLNAGISKEKTEAALQKMLRKYAPDSYKNEKNRTLFHLQPFREIHFNADYGPMQGDAASKPTLLGLALVALFLVLLGCINFINLSTAQASQRAREIGVRKTMGSSRRQLIFQFLNETFLLSLASTLLSVLFVPLLLKAFSGFLPADLKFNLLHQPYVAVFLLLLIVAVSLLSGLYPAFVLSRFQPAQVLKNQVFTGSSGSRRSWLRKGLTISQFFVAQVFVMATLMMVKQIHFMVSRDMGFRKEALVKFHVPVVFTADGYSKTDKRRFVVGDKLRSLPGITQLSLGSGEPASNSFRSSELKYVDGKKEVSTDVLMKFGDTNYLSLYHINLLAGRNVVPSDTIREYVINETYLHQLGFRQPREALNKLLEGKPIVGVIADYNQTSLHAQIKPLAFAANQTECYDFSIGLAPQMPGAATWQKTIAQMQAIYKSVYPDDDFNLEFFDENIAKFYQSEQNMSLLLKWATGLAIFISCMGLLGLVLYTTKQRTKEIGVRKVLGATVPQIVQLISRDFLGLVLIAFVIATPVAWYAMHRWLEDYAYRTDQSWWIFALSGLGLLLIALFTLSIQTIRAASANPVRSLRAE